MFCDIKCAVNGNGLLAVSDISLYLLHYKSLFCGVLENSVPSRVPYAIN